MRWGFDGLLVGRLCIALVLVSVSVLGIMSLV